MKLRSIEAITVFVGTSGCTGAVRTLDHMPSATEDRLDEDALGRSRHCAAQRDHNNHAVRRMTAFCS